MRDAEEDLSVCCWLTVFVIFGRLACVDTPLTVPQATKTTHANPLLELPVINPIGFVSACQLA